MLGFGPLVYPLSFVTTSFISAAASGVLVFWPTLGSRKTGGVKISFRPFQLLGAVVLSDGRLQNKDFLKSKTSPAYLLKQSLPPSCVWYIV
jgi:hypothetical protein